MPKTPGQYLAEAFETEYNEQLPAKVQNSFGLRLVFRNNVAAAKNAGDIPSDKQMAMLLTILQEQVDVFYKDKNNRELTPKEAAEKLGRGMQQWFKNDTNKKKIEDPDMAQVEGRHVMEFGRFKLPAMIGAAKEIFEKTHDPILKKIQDKSLKLRAANAPLGTSEAYVAAEGANPNQALPFEASKLQNTL